MFEAEHERARIMIVDDQIEDISVLKFILKKAGYSTFLCLEKADDALDSLATFFPDVILLDLYMPKVSGLVLLEQFQTLIPPESYLPIIVLTADKTQQVRSKVLSLGAKDILSKPLDSVEILLRVKHLLEARFLHLRLQGQNQYLEEEVATRTHELAVAHEALQRSREAIVTAREEERRRLRRDLHDGLGPTLAGEMLKIDAIRNLLRTDPDQAERLLVELKQHTQTAIADIRRLVYNLRPPALDDLGLLGALQAQALQYEGAGVHISIEVPGSLTPLSAAIEVAAYRIVQEGLTNVMRHAHARNCAILLRLDDAFHIWITDDGCGLPLHHSKGVGITSMRERAQELGGTFTIEGVAGQGTRLCARLPIRDSFTQNETTSPS
ncbi:MAG: response regulator [Ardenticatenales bacterium]|nr:response regulator [Ardenticatenales bacterium]